jgi:GNAT superfamily N-acetyltransferase
MRVMMNVRIREAVLGDEDSRAALSAFVQEYHRTQEPSCFKRAVPAEVAAWFRGSIEESTATIWIAEQEGTPVGYVVAVQNERSANPFCLLRRWIEIGRRLVDQVLQFARTENIADIELTSWCFNTDAHRAFQKLGFAPKVIRFARKVV